MFPGILGALLIMAGTAYAVTGASAAPRTEAPWKFWVVIALMGVFGMGVIQSIHTYLRARRTIREQIDKPRPTLEETRAIANHLERPLPFILILVPARNEATVITNTINRIAGLDYPRDRYALMVITDERELQDDVPEMTYDIATEMAKRLNVAADPFLYVLDVPEWYSGTYGDDRMAPAKSTKGRALNYALQQVRDDPRLSQTDMIGVLDADGRLHPEVLREVAHQVLTRNEKLMQGPVFQISNFANVDMAGKAAGIELSIYHLSTLSRQLLSKRNTMRFLAGTNYFIDRKLMLEVGGWNEKALVEDAELGMRVFLHSRITPAWLSCYEIEQTPPDRKVYLRQRERWATGHFQLLPMIRKSSLPLHTKIYLHGKVLYAALKSGYDIGLPVLGWLALALGWTKAMPASAGWLMVGLLVGSVFVWDFFGRGMRMLNKYCPVRQEKWAMRLLTLRFVVAMPWLILLQAQPRIVAMWKYLTRQHSGHWAKTVRTAETRAEPAPATELAPAPVDTADVEDHVVADEPR